MEDLVVAAGFVTNVIVVNVCCTDIKMLDLVVIVVDQRVYDCIRGVIWL